MPGFLWRVAPDSGTFRIPTIAGGHREIPSLMTSTAGPPGFPASLFTVAALYTLFAAWRQATRGRRTG